ncbi:hypothetical protein, partial [Oceanisphaera sp.]|uniref:hypothetical protein n=1 Tax=Oceanisphaera sp. TaxID=1929979 RepID=UPI003A8E624D
HLISQWRAALQHQMIDERRQCTAHVELFGAPATLARHLYELLKTQSHSTNSRPISNVRIGPV